MYQTDARHELSDSLWGGDTVGDGVHYDGNAGDGKRSNGDPPAVYVRFSDEMIVLGGSREQMEEIRGFMRIRLEALGLALNEEKTTILPADESVDFLGYRLSSAGKEIPAKAEDVLQERLEKVWMGTGTTAEKLRKGAEILNGLEQYYRGERKIASIEEFAVVVYMVRSKGAEVLDKVKAAGGNWRTLMLSCAGTLSMYGVRTIRPSRYLNMSSITAFLHWMARC